MLDFLKIRKGVDALAGQLREMAAQIEEAKQRREFLETAPLPRAEFADRLCAMLDAQGSEYPERLAQATRGFFRKPFWKAEESHTDIIATTGGQSRSDTFPKANVVWFLGDTIKTRVRDAVAVMPYPDEEAGPPLAERKAEIEQLNATIARLEAEREGLHEQARAAGIQLA